MLNPRHTALGLLWGTVLALLGCGPNTYGIARMRPGELKNVGDADICYAQRYWQSPQMLEEIRQRRLDCVTGTRRPEEKTGVAKKPKKTSKPVARGAESKPTTSSTARSGGSAVEVDADAQRAPPGGGDGRGIDLDAEVE